MKPYERLWFYGFTAWEARPPLSLKPAPLRPLIKSESHGAVRRPSPRDSWTGTLYSFKRVERREQHRQVEHEKTDDYFRTAALSSPRTVIMTTTQPTPRTQLLHTLCDFRTPQAVICKSQRMRKPSLSNVSFCEPKLRKTVTPFTFSFSGKN